MLIQAINNSKLKHAFFTSMAKDPVGFTNRWMLSQGRDLEMVIGEGGRFDGEWGKDGLGPSGPRGEWMRGKKWRGKEVDEAIKLMVRRDANARFKHAP